MSVRRKLGARRYRTYTDENLKAALTLVSSGEMSLRDISAMYNISKSTLSRKNNKQNMQNVGHPSVLTKVDEKALVSGLIAANLDMLGSSHKAKLKNTTKKSKHSNNNTIG